ncbi:hypothetical protein Poli38472_000423 [Pythium oligandrum]|uniref:Uncharacterized protein n=1 Tax=Pythium oligandrum TaxID=41045 RepID=A0A8K1CBP9_PYTOL|nr:hypothetical protein Poli38472_000423 [Pythium oligandrum]|eukprot:TMW60381.1 hypothetical protein Poli38472_000423 [Pythium oligandrum]
MESFVNKVHATTKELEKRLDVSPIRCSSLGASWRCFEVPPSSSRQCNLFLPKSRGSHWNLTTTTGCKGLAGRLALDTRSPIDWGVGRNRQSIQERRHLFGFGMLYCR